MNETDANSRQATAPGLELLDMITNQPSFDDSALDEQASVGPSGQTGQQHVNNESLPSHDDLNATDRSSASQLPRQTHSGRTTPTQDQANRDQKPHSHDEDDELDKIQKTMNDVIQELKSPPPTSPNSANVSRYSESAHPNKHDETNRSSPVLHDSSIKHTTEQNGSDKSPSRSRGGSPSIEHQPTSVAGKKSEENTSDSENFFGVQAAPSNTSNVIDDSFDHKSQKDADETPPNDSFFDTKTATIDDDHRHSGHDTSHLLDETTRFDANSPKHSRSRAQSTTSKRSIHAAPDETSAPVGENRDGQVLSGHEVNHAGTDSDPEKQEKLPSSRRSSRVKSPSIHSRTDALVTAEPDTQSTHSKSHEDQSADGILRMSPTKNASKSPSPTLSNHPPVDQESHRSSDIIPPSSPTEQRRSSRQSNEFPSSDKYQRLIKAEEPIHISDQSSDAHNENEGSDDHHHTKDTDSTRRSHDTNGDVHIQPTSSRRTSNVIQDENHAGTDVKSERSRESPTGEKMVQPSGSRRSSKAPSEHIIDSRTEEPSSSRRSSHKLQESASVTHEPEVSSIHEADNIQQKGHSRQSSTASRQHLANTVSGDHSQQSSTSGRASPNGEPKILSKRGSTVSEKVNTFSDQTPASKQDSSRRSSAAIESDKHGRKESSSHVPVENTDGSTSQDETERSSKAPNIHEKPSTSSKRGSTGIEHLTSTLHDNSIEDENSSTHRHSVGDDVPVMSKRASHASQHGNLADQEKVTNENMNSSRRSSKADDVKASSKRSSVALTSQPVTHQVSDSDEKNVRSRHNSVTDENKFPSKRSSATLDQTPIHQREMDGNEQKAASRKSSIAQDVQLGNKRGSHAAMSAGTTHFQSNDEGSKSPEQVANYNDEQKSSSRRSSKAIQPMVASKRQSTSSDYNVHSSEETQIVPEKSTVRKPSTSSEKSLTNKMTNVSTEKDQIKYESNRGVATLRHRNSDDYQPTSSDEQQSTKPLSKPSSRKTSKSDSLRIPNRDDAQTKASSHHSSSAHAGHESASPTRSLVIDSSETPLSTNRDNLRKSTDLTLPVPINQLSNGSLMNSDQPPSGHTQNESRRSSFNLVSSLQRNPDTKSESSHREPTTSDTDVTSRIPGKSKRSLMATEEVPRVPSSKHQDRERRQGSVKRNSGKHSKRNSNATTEETILTPIGLDSNKTKQQHSNYFSTGDSDNEVGTAAKLPPVAAGGNLRQGKTRLATDGSGRPDTKGSGVSQGTSASEDGKKDHWTTKIRAPSIHMSGDDASSAQEEQIRPRSPKVGQIAERNQPLSPMNKSGIKKQSTGDGQRKKEGHIGSEPPNRASRRSNSADSVTQIELVDDESLDSGSDHNVQFERTKRRLVRTINRDMGTNTDELYDPNLEYQQAHKTRSFHQGRYYDDLEYVPQKPLKAMKPISDHTYGTRKRLVGKDRASTTPDTGRDGDTPVIRRNVKQSKDGTNEKDPVNVNVTVVVKKFSGSGSQRTPRTTTETYVEEASSPIQVEATAQQRHVQTPPSQTAILPEGGVEQEVQQPEEPYFNPVEHSLVVPEETTEQVIEEKFDDIIERPKSTERQGAPSSKHMVRYDDRYTQSDPELTNKGTQKRLRRPKRVSRKCQTNESVFRRMEREQEQELRAIAENEKNIQTRKSQLRPRKKSPKKTLPVYLSNESFRVEDLLPSQFHQSRRNMSKSSAILRSLSPPGGKLLILRPTLPFHHTDAVNVQRVCLQYAIDLIPSDRSNGGQASTRRIKSTAYKQNEQLDSLPMIRASSPVTNTTSVKSGSKERSANHKRDDHSNHRKNPGAH